MYRDYRIVGVTPAGRKRYMQLLVPYIMDNKHLFDEYRFWINTNEPEDLAYIDELCSLHPDFFRKETLADSRPDLVSTSARVQLIRHFFRNCTDNETIYMRFDDDICWIHPQAIQRLLDFRIDNPEPFLVYPAIINSGRTAYIHQVMGFNPERLLKGWPGKGFNEFNLIKSPPEIAQRLHDAFLECVKQGHVDHLFFGRYFIRNYERVPINCIAFYGRDFATFEGIVGDDKDHWQEELWLTQVKARELGRPSCIWGQSLMAHFAFHTQRNHLEENTNLYLQYKLLCAQRRAYITA